MSSAQIIPFPSRRQNDTDAETQRRLAAVAAEVEALAIKLGFLDPAWRQTPSRTVARWPSSAKPNGGPQVLIPPFRPAPEPKPKPPRKPESGK